MGILKRFTDIMAANVNALLDKAEDPEKMADQYLRDLEDDFGKVQAETAAVMAEQKRAERAVRENDEEIEKMTNYATKALTAGNEEDAKVFLAKKVELEGKKQTLVSALDVAVSNANQMRQMHDKLQADITQVRQRKQEIKAKMAVAKTKERLNSLGSSMEGANNSMAAFDRMEEKANRMLDEADAKAELNQKPEDPAEALAKKYDAAPGTDTSAVDDELAELKASLGLNNEK